MILKKFRYFFGKTFFITKYLQKRQTKKKIFRVVNYDLFILHKLPHIITLKKQGNIGIFSFRFSINFSEISLELPDDELDIVLSLLVIIPIIFYILSLLIYIFR